ncbi:hypothetical protein GGTG_10043 [Gaeumannomyces tritici R3-111a-1]|uniref:Uncharacterized protein n=1 Tax=Gaeumannomyces tritici (strain R3-111a-1) TaxID=644352 RepID=J3P959_GAET3|nr:hypothetical protein GGTG_10043 [Gaeumannomyces tritici R3-111a-1]EJT73194.1 hypothetical protein GGTG_10043 [Gaeumannomyces tritici R3-111a-1]
MVKSAGNYLNLYTVFTVTFLFIFKNKFVIANIMGNVLLNCQFFKYKKLKSNFALRKTFLFSKLSEICGAFLVFCSGNLTALSNVLNVTLSVIISGAKLQMPFLNLFDPFR